MAGNDDVAKVRIEGDATGVAPAMQEAATAVDQGVQKMSTSMVALSAAVGGLTAMLMNMAGEVLGTVKDAFASIVPDTMNLTNEVGRLSAELGVTRTEASAIRMAIDDVGGTTQGYEGIVSKLSRTLRSNEEYFTKMGIATRDSAGHLLSMDKITQSTLQSLLQYKEGTDRNLAANDLLGRSFQSLVPYLRLTDEQMADSKKSAEELGLVIGDKQVENIRKYEIAINNAGDVLEGLKNQIGQVMIPLKTEMADWFASKGPQVIQIGIAAFGALQIAIATAMGSAKVIFYSFILAVQEVTYVLAMFARMMDSALHFDWNGVKAAWSTGTEMMRESAKKNFDAIGKAADDASMRIGDMVDLIKGKKGFSGGDAGPGGTATWKSVKKGKEVNRVQEWREELERRKMDEGEFFKDTTDMEREFWEKKLAIAKQGSKEWYAVRHILYGLARSDARQEEELLKLQHSAEMAETRRDVESKIQLAEQEAERIKEVYGEDSANYRRALMDKRKYELEFEDWKLRQAAEDLSAANAHAQAMLNIDRSELQFQKDLGAIKQTEYVERLRAIEDDEFRIKREGILARMELYYADYEEQARLRRELNKLDDDYNLKIKENSQQRLLAIRKEYEEMLSPIVSAIEKMVTGLIQGTLTWKKALSNFFGAILSEFISLCAKMVVRWILTELIKTKATKEQAAARSAAEQGSQSTSLMGMATNAIKYIMNSAAEAFAGVFAFLSGLMGPAAAGPAAGAQAMVAGMAGSVLFAERGFDIPSGVNPLVQAHAREMILPQEQADVIRGLAGNGVGAGAVHFHVTALDAMSVRDFFNKHGQYIAGSLRREGRNFNRFTS